MTTRVADIITRARDTLADPKKERWSDDRLLRLLDEAQKDFARQTSLLKGYANIPLTPYIATYNLPDDCWRLTRAHFAERYLNLLSFEAIDAIDINWYTKYSSAIDALVFDHRNENTIRCYPIPDAGIVDNTYAFVTTVTPDYSGAGQLGVVTSFSDYTLDTPYGVVTEVVDPEVYTDWFDSAFGVVTSVEEVAGNIAVFYIRDPSPIKYLTDELEVSSRWDIALKHYIIGHAFLDDLDSQYQARGATALSLYDRELQLAKRTSLHDSLRAQVYETSYDGGL